MSHQTGITMSILLAQTIALIPYIVLEINNHAMIESTGILRARQCHGRGTRTRTAATKAPIGNSRCIMVRERLGYSCNSRGSASLNVTVYKPLLTVSSVSMN